MSDILRDLVEPAELVAIRVGGESVQFPSSHIRRAGSPTISASGTTRI